MRSLGLASAFFAPFVLIACGEVESSVSDGSLPGADAGVLQSPVGNGQLWPADAGTQPAVDGGPAPDAQACATFSSSYAALQARVFDGHGCTAQACHGSAAVGGLSLTWGAIIS